MMLTVKSKRKSKLRKGQLSKKEPTLDDLGGSQVIQITKDSNIKKFTVGKCALKKGAKGVAGQSFTKEVGPNSCIQLAIPAETRMDMGLFRIDQ